jgi:hypothetical protein
MTVPATVFAPVGVPPDEEEAPDEELLLELVPPEEELLLEEVEPEEELLVLPEELPEEELLEEPLDELVPPGAVPEVAGAPPPPPPPHATKVSVVASVNA